MNPTKSPVRFRLLIKVLLAILLCALVPLVVIVLVSTQGYSEVTTKANQGYTEITAKAAQGYAEVTTKALQGYEQMAEEAIPPSKQALDERSQESFELRAYDKAQSIARFLYEREDDLRTLALLPRDAQAYRRFYSNNRSPIWTRENTVPGTRAWEEGIVIDKPLYREVAFIDKNGQEVIRIRDGEIVPRNELRDVSLPQNTTYKRENYYAQAMALAQGEIYVSEVLGWYLPVSIAYAAEENPQGQRYEGVIRFATPIFENGEKIGFVMLSLDHDHVMEFTNHMISNEERYRLEVGSITGLHSYIIDNRGWSISQGRHYYIVGLDERGRLVPSLNAEDAAEQAKTGYIPANLWDFGFIDPVYPKVCQENQEGVTSGSKEYVWIDQAHPEGRLRNLSYATIPYYTGRYNSPAGFGWVAVTADREQFHEPAALVEAAIEQTADRVEQEMQQTANQVEEGMQETADRVERQIEQERQELVSNTRLILGITVLAVAGIAVLLARNITSPIQTLVQGTEAIGRGDLDTRVEISSHDEIGQLAGAFNQMTVDLKHYTTELARTTAERERFVRELEIARDIQQSFLPRSWPQVEGLAVAAMNLPARHVGGDFYDFIPLAGGRLGLLVADVSDKGVPAALFMALSRSLIRAYSMGTTDVLTALKKANAFMLEDTKSSMFVTLFYAVVNTQTMHLHFINAGHNPPFLIGKDIRRGMMLKAKGIALGAIDDVFLGEGEVQLEPGDVLVLYTDGVTEAKNAQAELFGEERLKTVIEQHHHLPPAELMAQISLEVKAFTQDEPQFDDITLLVVKVADDYQPTEPVPETQEEGELQRHLRVSSRLENLTAISNFILEAAQDAGLNERQAYHVRLALDEACTNVIQYAYEGQEDGELLLHCWVEEDEFVVTLQDRGTPFDPHHAPAPDLGSSWEDRPIGGLGVYLIQQLVDRIKYESDPEQGNILWLIKQITPASDESTPTP
ncbi:MAG: SpoIIE family protein phosphatase [Chloroflexia bacterium]|nr:SpoIIE family protein phosphatase [Chloroflexia bacterium]